MNIEINIEYGIQLAAIAGSLLLGSQSKWVHCTVFLEFFFHVNKFCALNFEPRRKRNVSNV